MDIFLSWQLVVTSIIFLISVASSELELSELFDPPIDSSPYYQTLKGKTPIKFSSMLYKSVCVNIYDSQTTISFRRSLF